MINIENEEILDLITQIPEVNYVIDLKYIQDGGARQFNGKGTMMLCEHYERQRNKGVVKEKTEELFRKVFGVKNFIWVPYACVYDDSDYVDNIKEENGKVIQTIQPTEGHIDGFAMFAGPDKIIHTSLDNIEDDETTKENTRRLNINLNVLKEAKDQNWNNFKILFSPL
jgi:agmatine deiminase